MLAERAPHKPAERLSTFGQCKGRGFAYSGLDTYVLRGRAPWTFHHRPDHTTLKKASECPTIDCPKPDGEVSFDKNSSVFLSATNHEEDQPPRARVHLAARFCKSAVTTDYANLTGPPAYTAR